MDKTAIKNFSIWARNKLIADITYKAGLLGVTEEGIKDALPQSTQDAEFYDIGTKEPYAIHGEEIKQRKELVAAIKRKATQLDYKDAYRNVVEEVAYTWFNRLIAIRFMEVNDYMPAHIRVLSSDSKNKLEPDLVTTPFDAELEFTQAETEKIMQMKNDNQVDALFRFLFIKQCNALNAYLPKLFEKTSDYTELLLNVSVTDQDGIVYHLTHDINEADFNITDLGEDGKPTGQVEIIGWMYQYYNTEPKDEAFALLKSNVKITKERIPAATQLFTPDWIVRYMVENSVGRLWLEGHEDNNLKDGWKYYLDEAEQEADVAEQLKAIREEYKNIKPEEIKVIDPCMGSGHILVYAFDVLMQIYESYGYSQRDAAKSIVENNIYGLDIDDRAFQLAYFAIMMKARSYNRRFLTLEIEPNLCAIQESNGLQYDQEMGDFLLSEEHRETLKYLLHTFVDAKEYGSIINVEKRDYDSFLEAWELTAEASLGNVLMMLWYNECNQLVPLLAKQARILTSKYDVTVTNPPYMGAGNMNTKLTAYVKKHYPKTKADMSTVFMEKGMNLCKDSGFMSMINIPVWMFISSFEKLREKIVNEYTIVNMIYPGRGIFGSDFGTTTFVFWKPLIKGYVGKYYKLFEKQSAVDTVEEKERLFFERKGECNFVQSNYLLIPGTPLAFWISDAMLAGFNGTTIKDFGFAGIGMRTGDNERFLRLWFEVDYPKLGLGIKSVEDLQEKGVKWIPYNKGGDFRRWYGNNSYVVNWENNGYEIKENTKKVYPELGDNLGWKISNEKYYFRPGITWTGVTMADFSCRLYPEGFIFDSGANGLFAYDPSNQNYLAAFLNSKIANDLLRIINPTVNTGAGTVNVVPIKMDEELKSRVNELVESALTISKTDWDSFETSWEYQKHPLILEKEILDTTTCNIKDLFKLWERNCEERYEKLLSCEKEINQIFIEQFGLTGELHADISEVTIRKADESREIRSLISYAVGCMLGRYTNDIPGILFAGGERDNINTSFIFDTDGIIPITDEEYFTDDIIGKFVEWIKITFGEATLEDNLLYISQVLGNKGDSPLDIIRSYFLTEFYKDHCTTYSVTGSGKRPIYWLFDSGKQNGFKALIYMHRYNADTIGNLRVDYLHRMERIYESEINRMQDTIDNSSNAREVTAATKRKEKLQKQLKECQEYDEKIGHLALSRIEIDLDDGVKVNYEKVQTASDGKKYQVLAKI